MKKAIKLLSVVLCVVMLVSSLPMSGFVALGAEISEAQSQKIPKYPDLDYATGNIDLSQIDYLQGITESNLRLPELTESTDPGAELGELVEINEFSKVYQTGDRKFTSVITGTPNFYYDNKGNEVEYDNSLVEKKKIGTNEFVNKSSDIDVSISADVLKKGISFDYKGVKVSLIPTDGNYSKYIVTDNAIRYNDVFDGVDVQYTINETGIKEDIILNKYIERNTFSYRIEVSSHRFELQNGVILVYENETADEPIYTISAPVMIDAAGETSNLVELNLNGDILTVTADNEWLSANERSYPVKIDPNMEIKSGLAVRSVVEDGDRVYISAVPYAYGYAGYIRGQYFGFSGNLGRSKMLVYVPANSFAEIPEGAGILNAAFHIYQYVAPSSSTNFTCSIIRDSWNIDSYSQANQANGYTRGSALNAEVLSMSSSKTGWHEFDIRTAVNNWVNFPEDGINGLMIAGQYNTSSENGGAFVTNTSDGAEGAGAYASNKPYITLTWEVPNPVPLDYPLNQTTINLRTFTKSTRDGMLAFLGVSADGVAKPHSIVYYNLNDSSVSGGNGAVEANISYEFPDSVSSIDGNAAWNTIFPEKTTKYKDILSNWQTLVPVTDFKENTLYNYSAYPILSGTQGNTATSNSFLKYKITRYDTLDSIANHYGVPVIQLATDNHVQDMLLIENNTIVVVNPTRNANNPYNPGTLSESDKQKIDGALMGRALHCEFGYEPVNLNSGNFYMNQSDISIADLNGDFGISRTYNSKAANINSIFGRGWQFDYAEQISKLANGEFAYWRGDGSTLYFTPDGRGNYICNDGYYLDFKPIYIETKYANFGGDEDEPYDVYEYEITDQNGKVSRFSRFGKLISVTDEKGMKTTLSYDDSGKLTGLTSPGGIKYVITCDSQGRITSVTKPDGAKVKYVYDANDNLITFTDELGSVTRYNYDAQHRMTSWVDAEGHSVTTNVYDSEGRVTKQTDSEGNVTNFAYTANKTTTTDANGNVTVYNYDSNYRTTSIVYADGSVERKEYDSSNNLSKATDRNGKSTQYSYNSDGFVTKITRFDGATQSYTYDAKNNVTSMTDFDGITAYYTYNSKGNMTSSTDKNGNKKTYEFDAKNRLVKFTDENGKATTYEYGNIWLTKQTNAAGKAIEYYYNSCGELVTTVDALGNKTRYTYDAAGRNTGKQFADGSTENYSYDKTGCLSKLTTANGYVYSYEYDGIGNITKLIDPLSNEVVYTYDGLYNTLSTTYADGITESSVYDCFSQVVSSTNEEGGKTQYTYDNAGNKTSVTDPKGNKTSYTYDLRFNKVTKETDALGNTTEYKYNTVGNMTEKIDPNGAKTTYAYDANGNVTTVTYSNGLVETYTYDKAGKLTGISNNTGYGVTYVYDNVYNIVSESYTNGTVHTYTYDANGNTLTKTDGNGITTKYAYDNLGRLVSKTDGNNVTISYTYDANGNLLTETTPKGTTSYVYDALDRVCKETDALGNSVTYKYDKIGNLTSTTDKLSYVTSYTYNKLGMPLTVTDPLSGVTSYQYDANGNVTSSTDVLGNTSSNTFDALDRVVANTNADGNTTNYSYDAMGNVASVTDPMGGTTSYAYDAVYGKVTKATDALGGVTSYEYDRSGNNTKVTDANGAATVYIFDVMGNVTSITYSNGLVETFEYDKEGNVVKASNNDGLVIKYTYDGNYNLISEEYPDSKKITYTYDSVGNVLTKTDFAGAVTEYEYDALSRVVSVTDSLGRKTAYTYDALGNLLGKTLPNGGNESYTYDALSRLRKTTDALGNSTYNEYDAAGNTLKVTDAMGNAIAYTYSKTGLPLTMTDPMAGVTTFAYDKNGNLTSAVDALGYKAEISYDALGRTKTTKDALGLITTFTYDAAGNLLSDSNNNGVSNSYTYNAVGALTSDTDSLGQTVAYTYDKSGNLIGVKSYDSSETKYTYDVFANMTSMTDPENKKTVYGYDKAGNLVSEKDSQNRTYSYAYDSVGRTISVTDPLGQKTSYEYNALDLVTKETNAANKSKQYAYDLVGNIISATDENGNTTEYSYDNIYRLISVKYADSTTDSYKYDKNNNLLSKTDAAGNKTAYTYNALGYTTSVTVANGAKTTIKTDAAGNVLSETNALGAKTEYTYDKAGQLLSTVLANGAKYGYEYDALGRTIKETMPEGLSKSYAYNAKGDLEKVTDQSGRATAYTYDIMHRITSVTDAKGNKTGFTYDKSGNVSTMTTANGNVTKYSYDALDRVTKLLNPTGSTEEYKYDPLGNVTEIVENGGRTTKYEYDAVGNLTKLTNALGNSKSFSYDKVYNLTSETDFAGNAVRYSYDKLGNVTKVTDRVGNSTVYTYNEVSALTSEKDGAGRTKSYAYDLLGQLTSVVEDGKYESKYAYDVVGNLTSAGGYTYTYDLLGNMTSATNAIGKVTEYVYNRNGMLATVKNADGSTVNYDYDAIDELISKNYDGKENVALYGFDKDGNRVSMTDVAGTTSYEYDAEGKITAIKLANGKSKITYEYDSYDNLVKLGYPDGTSVTYKYDILGQLVALTNREGKTTSYKYDKNGNVTEVHRPNETYTEITYDANDRVTSLVNYGMINFLWFFKKTVPVSTYSYEYDASGNIISESTRSFSTTGENDFFTWLIAQIKKETTTTTYEYDGRNQLISESSRTKSLFSTIGKSGSHKEYEYDVSGNRVMMNDNGEVTSYTYNEAGQLTKAITGKKNITYSYDANGNLISEKGSGCLGKEKDYTYNNENRLTAVKENGALLMAALYDGDGERIFVLSDHDGCSVPCCNDKSLKNLEKDTNEIDIDDSVIINTLLIPNGVDKRDYNKYDLTGYINNVNTEYTQVLLEYAANEKVTATYEYGAFRESAKIDGKQYYYEYDARGSVSALVNSKGKNVVTYSYDAYGVTSSSCSTVENPYQYNAEYTDNATGLQYLRARYYRAQTGSFITADTYAGRITTPLSLNRYTYTHNNPVNGKDPSGHFVFTTACLIVAGVAAAVTAVSYGVKKYSESKAKNTVAKINEKTNEKTQAEKNATVVESNSSQTYISGNSVNYKNKIYTFKTEEEAISYHKLCDELDKLDKEKAKYETIIKVSNVVQKAGLLTTGVALTLASGGTSNFILAGAMSGAGFGIGSEVVTQTITSDGSIMDKLTSDVDYKGVAISAGTGTVTGMISGGINAKVTAKGTDLALKIGKKIAPNSQVVQKVIGRGLTGLVSGGLSSAASDTVNQVVDIATGESDEFSLKELGIQTLTGSGMGGFFGAISGYIEGKTIDKKIAENRSMSKDDPNKAKRLDTVGATPSKTSDVGQQVIERQLQEGTARYNNGVLEYLDPTDLENLGITSINDVDPSKLPWRTVGSDTHMGHIHGAAEWWSDGGYKFGAGSEEAKAFMNNSSNYRLEYGPNNISKGQVDKKLYGYFK